MTDEGQTMTMSVPAPSDFEGRRAFGRAARVPTPRTSHAAWSPPEDRTDPVSLLEEQAVSRVADLVPIRHGRMMVSPFTFYRGAALLMAADLAHTPSSGLIVQLCGDAHLSNFGLFAQRRAPPGLRHQRLRRDAPRAVRVGRQAAGRERGDRRPVPRLHRPGAPGEQPRRRARLSRADAAGRRIRRARGLVRPPRCRQGAGVAAEPARARSMPRSSR